MSALGWESQREICLQVSADKQKTPPPIVRRKLRKFSPGWEWGAGGEFVHPVTWGVEGSEYDGTEDRLHSYCHKINRQRQNGIKASQ